MSIFNGKAEDIFNKKSDYPIGSICMFKATINPNELYGGTWARIEGRFILGADGSIYPLGSKGGEATHKLTVAEMPKHDHGEKQLVGSMWNIASQSKNHNLAAAKEGIVSTAMVEGHGYAMNSTTEAVVDGFEINATHTHDSVGGGQPYNNMPPYVALYIWTKVAS